MRRSSSVICIALGATIVAIIANRFCYGAGSFFHEEVATATALTIVQELPCKADWKAKPRVGLVHATCQVTGYDSSPLRLPSVEGKLLPHGGLQVPWLRLRVQVRVGGIGDGGWQDVPSWRDMKAQSLVHEGVRIGDYSLSRNLTLTMPGTTVRLSKHERNHSTQSISSAAGAWRRSFDEDSNSSQAGEYLYLENARVFVEAGLAQPGIVSVLGIARPALGLQGGVSSTILDKAVVPGVWDRPTGIVLLGEVSSRAMVNRVSLEYASWKSVQAFLSCCIALLTMGVFGVWIAVWPDQACLSSSLVSAPLVSLAIVGCAVGCGFVWSRLGDTLVIMLSLAVGILSASVVRAVPHVLSCCCCSPDHQSVRAAAATSASEVGIAAHRATVRSQQESGDCLIDLEFNDLVSELTALSDQALLVDVTSSALAQTSCLELHNDQAKSRSTVPAADMASALVDSMLLRVLILLDASVIAIMAASVSLAISYPVPVEAA